MSADRHAFLEQISTSPLDPKEFIGIIVDKLIADIFANQGANKNNKELIERLEIPVAKDYELEYTVDGTVNYTEWYTYKVSSYDKSWVDDSIRQQYNDGNFDLYEGHLDDTQYDNYEMNDWEFKGVSEVDPKVQESLLSNEISKVDIYRKLFDECFAPIRFNDYQNWIKIGMAIKNTIIKSDDALQLFIYYSSKGANYEGIEPTTRKYNSYKVKYNGYGVGTIYKMAIEDNKPNAIRILGSNKLQSLNR